jgi:hypothetical protein
MGGGGKAFGGDARAAPWAQVGADGARGAARAFERGREASGAGARPWRRSPRASAPPPAHRACASVAPALPSRSSARVTLSHSARRCSSEKLPLGAGAAGTPLASPLLLGTGAAASAWREAAAGAGG